MRKIIAACVLVWLLVPGAFAQDLSLFEKKMFISKQGDTLPYRVLYPAGYDPSRKYPLVLFLHGAGERGSDNEKQLVHGAKLFLADSNRSAFPAIIVFPQCPQNSYWGAVKIDRSKQPLEIRFDYREPMTPPLRAAVELTRRMVREEGVDKKRVYVTGLSMGGMGTFEIVYRQPKLFAAAVPICGGGDSASYHKKLAKIPFRVYHGASDRVVDAQLSRTMVERLQALGASVQYKEYPGVDHNSWDPAFAEPDFLPWIFAQRK